MDPAKVHGKRYEVHVCMDCGEAAHYNDRCLADRRRKWTQMDVIETMPVSEHRRIVLAASGPSLKVNEIANQRIEELKAENERLREAAQHWLQLVGDAMPADSFWCEPWLTNWKNAQRELRKVLDAS